MLEICVEELVVDHIQLLRAVKFSYSCFKWVRFLLMGLIFVLVFFPLVVKDMKEIL